MFCVQSVLYFFVAHYCNSHQPIFPSASAFSISNFLKKTVLIALNVLGVYYFMSDDVSCGINQRSETSRRYKKLPRLEKITLI